MAAPGPLSQGPDGHLRLQVKVVPGAAHDALAGTLRSRLKVRVCAPPAAGAANAALLALLALLAGRLGLCRGDLDLVAGHGSPLMTLAIRRCGLQHAQRALGLA